MTDNNHDDEDDIVDINDEVDDDEDEIVGEASGDPEERAEAATFKRHVWIGMVGEILKQYLMEVTELPHFSIITVYRRILNHPVLTDAEFMKIPFDNLTEEEFEDIADGLGEYEANLIPNLPMTHSQRMQQAFKDISGAFTLEELLEKGHFKEEEFHFVNLTEFFWFMLIWEIGGVHHEYRTLDVLKVYDEMTVSRITNQRPANHRALITTDLPPLDFQGKEIRPQDRVVPMVPYLLYLIDRAVANWNFENQHYCDGEKRARAYVQ